MIQQRLLLGISEEIADEFFILLNRYSKEKAEKYLVVLEEACIRASCRKSSKDCNEFTEFDVREFSSSSEKILFFEGFSSGHADGKKEGHSSGYQEGFKNGYDQYAKNHKAKGKE